MKLTRKQKTAVNLLLIAVSLFLLAWMWKFPSWTREGLLRRAEQRYLLTDSEVLFVGEEENKTTIFARNGDSLLAVTGDRTLLGWRLRTTFHREEEDGILCLAEREADSKLRYLAFGNLAEVHRAELEVLLDLRLTENDVFVGHLQESYLARGQRIAEGGFVFQLERHYGEEDASPLAKVENTAFSNSVLAQGEHLVLRLYDENGMLIHEKEMRNIDTRHQEVWPEVGT